MIAATSRSGDGARLLVLDAHGALQTAPRARLVDFFQPGDVLVANDAATLPASLLGKHVRTGSSIEVRLAARPSLQAEDIHRFEVIVLGEGDHHQRTEDRAAPPALLVGDALHFASSLHARVTRLLGHPRHVELDFELEPDAFWSLLARTGRPIQYAHVPGELSLFDVWTIFAGPPVAFEAPSAAFALDWAMTAQLHARGVQLVTLTHAAGISSTGDAALDEALPFDEAYRIPASTVRAIREARAEGRRVIALGTSVVRALEAAADANGRLHAGTGIARGRLGVHTKLLVVDALLSGTHERGTSHYELLRAFASEAALEAATQRLEDDAFRTHEFGDSVLVFAATCAHVQTALPTSPRSLAEA